MNINETRCPECDHRLKLGAHPHTGQRLICPMCETSLTLTSLSPVELDLTMSVNHVESTKKRPHTIAVPCPECENIFRINLHTHQGNRLRCSSCDTTLEVVSTTPLELDVALTARLEYLHRDTFDEVLRHPTKKAGRTWRQSK